MDHPERPRATVRVGVAGWDYPDWNGIVYPARPGRGFDRLAHVARYVDVIEINSSFYRPVDPRVAETWLRRTAGNAGFRFTAKAHRACTHEPEVAPETAVAGMLDGLRPLREAGRLEGLLLQFPQSFHFTPAAVERLDRLTAALDGWPVVVEVRHAGWESERAGSWFRRRGVGWCTVDQPRIGRSTAGRLERVTGPLAYLRLHGRNAAEWFRPGAGRDARYDYLYSESEVRELAASARALAGAAASLVVIQNNHFRGQAMANALQLEALLQASVPAAPEELVAAYPALEPLVRVSRTRLF